MNMIMEAKLDVNGLLSIKRKGIFRNQYCPETQEPCGDYCPKLIEEDPMDTFDTLSISVCNWQFILVIDERKEEE